MEVGNKLPSCILCIEDDPIYLTLRKKVLEKDGYTVIGVTNVG